MDDRRRASLARTVRTMPHAFVVCLSVCLRVCVCRSLAFLLVPKDVCVALRCVWLQSFVRSPSGVKSERQRKLRGGAGVLYRTIPYRTAPWMNGWMDASMIVFGVPYRTVQYNTILVFLLRSVPLRVSHEENNGLGCLGECWVRTVPCRTVSCAEQNGVSFLDGLQEQCIESNRIESHRIASVGPSGKAMAGSVSVERAGCVTPNEGTATNQPTVRSFVRPCSSK
mmetsp:Transcript_3557/g.7819  ORF Transcript_3557/g.7819 Transcript_3557/m.7819 type:complete len:225 (+) Transcript_3557:271-945(+)